MTSEEKQSFKDSFLEILAIIKVCLTSFWFYVPALFAIYMYVQLYMIVINPLLLLVGPTIIIVYALLWEEKRLKAQYGLKDVKILRSSDPLFSSPRQQTARAEVEELVEEYKKMLKKKPKKSEKNEKE